MIARGQRTPMLLVLAVALTTLALARLLARSAPTRTAGRLAALFLIGWSAVVGTLAACGLLETPADADAAPPPVVVLTLLTTTLLAIASRTAALRAWLAAIPTAALVRLQVYRGVGALVLVAALQGQLPWVFAGPAGLGGVLVALTAWPVAARVEADPLGSGPVLRAWHLLGLADLAVAMTLGALTGPGPLHLLAPTLPSTAITHFPLVLTPAFLVPLSLALHLATWPRKGSAEPGRVPGPAD